MGRFWVVVLAGFLGGILCGVVIGVIPVVLVQAPHVYIGSVGAYALLGAVEWGPFGIVMFPVCYYLFLANLPLRFSLSVTIPATIIVALLFELLPIFPPNFAGFNSFLYWLVNMYGPGFFGLVLTCFALNWFTPKVAKRG